MARQKTKEFLQYLKDAEKAGVQTELTSKQKRQWGQYRKECKATGKWAKLPDFLGIKLNEREDHRWRCHNPGSHEEQAYLLALQQASNEVARHWVNL